jgi:hypothetical protein
LILCEQGGSLTDETCQLLVTEDGLQPLRVLDDPFVVTTALHQAPSDQASVQCAESPCNLVLLATGDEEVAHTPVQFASS